ncbi:MAG TPA: Lrp/AsnC family transcriptional regulator, partial [Thermoanaerobaculia bacterium]|nr:Lrp/AsnC family transcriptional regulator [Thermoanaerobaculia bacterium]
LLSKDGRLPAAQLGEQVGLSRPAVAERIEKLERNGVIRGTTAVIDPNAVGRFVTAFVAARVNGNLPSSASKAFQQMMRSEEVLEVHTVAGEDCFYIKVRTDSLTSLNVVVNKLTHAPFNLVTRTTIVMKTHCEKLGGIILGEAAE